MAFDTITDKQLEHLLSVKPSINPDLPTVTDSSFIRLLTSIDRTKLSRLMHEEKVEPGAIIFKEGADGDAMYLVWSGKVVIMKGNWDSPTILGFRGPGEVLGEMTLLDNQKRSASVIALEESRLLKLGRGGFQEFLNSNPAVSHKIMASLSARLRESDNVRNLNAQVGKQLVKRVTTLQTEKEQLLELQRVRQETSDLIIHDLRNPLGLMYSAIQMLEMVLPEEIHEPNQELFQIANSAYSRMRRLVDSLLDVAKMESSELEMNLVLTNVGDLVQDIVTELSFGTSRRNIVVSQDIPEDLPLIAIDSERIGRVLANLLDNAMKFMPQGGAIDIQVHQTVDQGETPVIAISITDTGPGIPPVDRERIFERFTQVQGEPKQRRGFGLGLAFCRLAVEAHNGRIWVEDGPSGVGSRFTFTLPVDPA